MITLFGYLQEMPCESCSDKDPLFPPLEVRIGSILQLYVPGFHEVLVFQPRIS